MTSDDLDGVSAGSTDRLTESFFPQLWAAFLLLLIAASYPLWFDLAELQGERAAMPSVSLFGPGWSVPVWIELPVIVVLVIALSLIVCQFNLAKDRQPLAWTVVAVSLAIAFLADHHRLQPWAYQSALYAVIFATVPATRRSGYLILLAVSVYVFSALGKLDYQFTHTVGLDFLRTLASPLNERIGQADAQWLSRFALIFPLTELLLAVALVPPWTRRVAAIGIILMHLTLIGILGPWSLGHSWGVLIWNTLLALQAWLLFFRGAAAKKRADKKRPRPETHLKSSSVDRRVIAQVVIAIAILAPMFERRGYWDHWLSWSLYSPHTSRVEIEIHRSRVERLGPQAAAYLQADHDGDGWQGLSLADWSLAARGVPIYPQARFQLSLAIKLARDAEIEDGIRVKVREVSDRWTGRRDEHRLVGRKEMESFAERFWLSSPPRT